MNLGSLNPENLRAKSRIEFAGFYTNKEKLPICLPVIRNEDRTIDENWLREICSAMSKHSKHQNMPNLTGRDEEEHTFQIPRNPNLDVLINVHEILKTPDLPIVKFTKRKRTG